MEQIRLTEKKCSCKNHLLAKPGDQTAKAVYKTVRGTLQASGPCRMTGRQHLLRGHNTMLTWAASTPSMTRMRH